MTMMAVVLHLAMAAIGEPALFSLVCDSVLWIGACLLSAGNQVMLACSVADRLDGRQPVQPHQKLAFRFAAAKQPCM